MEQWCVLTRQSMQTKLTQIGRGVVRMRSARAVEMAMKWVASSTL
jgi:hypothetical protein